MDKEHPNLIVLIVRAIVDAFKALPTFVKSGLTVFVILCFMTWFMLPRIVELGADQLFKSYINPSSENLKKMVANEMMKDSLVQREKDSLAVVLSKINVNNRRQIYYESFKIEKRLKGCLAVNFWSIHNGGEALDVDGKWYLEVYVSSRQENEEDFRNPPPIYTGFQWLGIELEKNVIMYFGDVSKYPELYKGKSKMHLDIQGVKSVIGAFVFNNKGKEWLYVTIDFSILDPLKENPDLFREINNYRRYVTKRI